MKKSVAHPLPGDCRVAEPPESVDAYSAADHEAALALLGRTLEQHEGTAKMLAEAVLFESSPEGIALLRRRLLG